MHQSYQKNDLISYAIYLKGHQAAKSWLPNLLSNAQKFNWSLQLYEGINGSRYSCYDFNIKIDQRYSKSKKQMEKLGVQGCFLSHWHLWKKCIELNKHIGIFEFDVVFKNSPPSIMETDVLKLAGFKAAKPASTGQWWGGAYAYILSPTGAKKLLDWTDQWGASPADFMLGDNVLDITFDLANRVELATQGGSTTENISQELH
jgi:GR25 family glycosyltransferase involved in LPS biosynthesis